MKITKSQVRLRMLISLRRGVDGLTLAIVALVLYRSELTAAGALITLIMSLIGGTAIGMFDAWLPSKRPFIPRAEKTAGGRLKAGIHGGIGAAAVALALALLAAPGSMWMTSLWEGGPQLPGIVWLIAISFCAGVLGGVIKTFFPTVRDLDAVQLGPRRAGGHLTGADLMAIRERLRLSTLQMSRVLGHAGDAGVGAATIESFESGKRPIPLWFSRLAVMVDQHGIPDGWQTVVPAGDEATSVKPQHTAQHRQGSSTHRNKAQQQPI